MVVASDVATAVVDAVLALDPRAEGESTRDYMIRLETARWAAAWSIISAQARVSVNTTVGAGIAVAVAPLTGIGATTAPGVGTDTAGTIA